MEDEKRKLEVETETNDSPKKIKIENNIITPVITEENKEAISKKIIKQIHFYFSDSNMNDKFLRKKLAEDKDGFIDLSIITSFNRMKEICIDIAFICEVLKNSTKVIVEGTRIKRSTPWPTEDKSFERTVFAKNIPPQWKLDDIEVFFEKYGTVNRVQMMKNKGIFEGNVFIEYDTLEEAKKAVEAKPMLEGKIVEIEFKRESKESNPKKKKEKAKKEAPKDTYVKFSGIDTNAVFNNISELFKIHGNPWVIYKNKDDFGYLKFKSLDLANKYIEVIKKAKQEFYGKELDYSIVDESLVKSIIEESQKKEEFNRLVIKFSGLDVETNFNELKDFLKSFGNPWVVYENKSDHGFLKFLDKAEGEEYFKKVSSDPKTFKDKPVTFTILEGEEEKNFWEKINKKGKPKKGKGKGKGKRNNRKK